MKAKLMHHNDDHQQKWGNCADTRKYLAEYTNYEVDKTEEHDHHTKIFLKDYPGLGFNSICFKFIDELIKDSNCCLNEAPHYQCCCACDFLIIDYSHPCTDGKKLSNIRGWICTVMTVVYDENNTDQYLKRGGCSGWHEHSCGCEMFNVKEGCEIAVVDGKRVLRKITKD